MYSEILSVFYFSIPWFTEKRIGKNSIGNLLPALCEVANVPRLTNNSIRPTSIRAMRRGGFDRNVVAFVSGHKDPDTLMNYDGLTTLDKTKLALSIQKGPATLDGDRVDLDQLARKRKRDNPDSLNDEIPLPSTSKKVTFSADDIQRAEVVYEDSGLGNSVIGDNPDNDDEFDGVHAMEDFEKYLATGDGQRHFLVVPRDQVKEPDAAVGRADRGHIEEVPGAVGHVAQAHADNDGHRIQVHVSQPNQFQPESGSTDEPILQSSQAHNVARLITDHISSSKELINNYISAMKKKK